MSAQTNVNAFAPIYAKYRADILASTWGHLAPKRGKVYSGHIVFALGCFGNDSLNPTVLSYHLGDLDSSPWFFEALIDFLRSLKGTAGEVYRWEGTFKNYDFEGTLRCLPLS